jgi:hypothetical protein
MGRGRKQHYPIELSETERQEVEAIVKTGTQAARVRRRAQTLLRLPSCTG